MHISHQVTGLIRMFLHDPLCPSFCILAFSLFLQSVLCFSASRTPTWLVPLSRTALPQSFACLLVSLLSFRDQLKHQDTLITLGNSALFVNLWVHLLDGKHYEKGTVLFSVVPRTLPDAWETFDKYTFIEWINEWMNKNDFGLSFVKGTHLSKRKSLPAHHFITSVSEKMQDGNWSASVVFRSYSLVRSFGSF